LTQPKSTHGRKFQATEFTYATLREISTETEISAALQIRRSSGGEEEEKYTCLVLMCEEGQDLA
jgi:hypothetical protein